MKNQNFSDFQFFFFNYQILCWCNASSVALSACLASGQSGFTHLSSDVHGNVPASIVENIHNILPYESRHQYAV